MLSKLIFESFKTLPFGLILLDDNHIIKEYNIAAGTMLSLPNAQLAGHEWSVVFQAEDVRVDPAHAILEKRSFFREWCKLVRSDGSFLHVLKIEQAIKNAEGHNIATLITLSDNTEEQHYISRLERARERAEEAAKSKSTFLANMSHELRTPLNSILGMTDLALDLSSSQEQTEYLSILRASAESLLQLISSLLDYIKLENDKMGIQVKSFQLNDFLEEVMPPIAIQCQAKGIAFHLIIDPAMETSLIGDSVRLSQILANFLSNALKFTDQGQISLLIKQKSNEHEPDQDIVIEWILQDTGCGIPEAQLFRIFEPFVQLDGSATRNAGGTGIGLSITKGLVELMNGSIVVHSKIGEGSTFSFTTKLKIGPRVSSVNVQKINLESEKVLIIGDNDAWAAGITCWLEHFDIDYKRCVSYEDVEHEFKYATNTPLCIFSGMFKGRQQLLLKQSNSIFERLHQRRHIISVRFQHYEEKDWQTAGFRYETLPEPIRPQKMIATVQMLHFEYMKEMEVRLDKLYLSPVPRSILYVEDDVLSSVIQIQLMQSAGHRISHVLDAQSAIEILGKNRFDLIILDIELPGMNGYELAGLLRGGDLGQEFQNIPIIALTAHSSDSDLRHSKVLGMNAFLTKPFFPKSLLYAIDRVSSLTYAAQEDSRAEGRGDSKEDLLLRMLQTNQFKEAERILLEIKENMYDTADELKKGVFLKALFKIRSNDSAGSIEILRHSGIIV